MDRILWSAAYITSYNMLVTRRSYAMGYLQEVIF
jgi:hypothetical protein